MRLGPFDMGYSLWDTDSNLIICGQMLRLLFLCPNDLDVTHDWYLQLDVVGNGIPMMKIDATTIRINDAYSVTIMPALAKLIDNISIGEKRYVRLVQCT